VVQATQVMLAPLLTLITWKHSVAPCDRGELNPSAFIQTLLDMTLNGLLPIASSARPAA
jgi:hypothetical protein